jgi:hypothetical protein
MMTPLLDRDILTTNSNQTLVRFVVAAYEPVHDCPLPTSAMRTAWLSSGTHDCIFGRNFSNISLFNRLRFGK